MNIKYDIIYHTLCKNEQLKLLTFELVVVNTCIKILAYNRKI